MGWRSPMAAKGLAASSIDFFGEGSVSSLRVGTSADKVLLYCLLEVFEGDWIDVQHSVPTPGDHYVPARWVNNSRKKDNMPVAGPSNQISGDSSVD